MLLRSDEYFSTELQDEEIENRDYTEILAQLKFVRESVFDKTSQNISTAQISQKKYYDIRHSRNFKFAKNDLVIKFLPRNSQRKGGKLDNKFWGPYVIDEITNLGIARLRTPKGDILKKGVPIKQLQKYNKKEDGKNYLNTSSTSSETQMEDKPRKRRRMVSHSESSNSDVDVMSEILNGHDIDSNRASETHKKQEQTLSVKQSVTPAKPSGTTLSVKQSVTPAKPSGTTLSVKQSVTPAKPSGTTLSVKQSVTPAKPSGMTLSVKQSVTNITANDNESFTRTPKINRKKIILTPIESPITRIKGGIKKIHPPKQRFIFQHFANKKEKTETEIELCETLPDLDELDEKSEDKQRIELCDTLDTLPDILVNVENKKQTDICGKPKTKSSVEIEETGFFEGDPVLFFPITNST